jgi:hypothetical protein
MRIQSVSNNRNEINVYSFNTTRDIQYNYVTRPKLPIETYLYLWSRSMTHRILHQIDFFHLVLVPIMHEILAIER